jgi:hypothetical protein
MDVQIQLFLAARGAGGRKAQGGQPFVARSWRASETELLAAALRTIRGHASLFNPALKKRLSSFRIANPPDLAMGALSANRVLDVKTLLSGPLVPAVTRRIMVTTLPVDPVLCARPCIREPAIQFSLWIPLSSPFRALDSSHSHSPVASLSAISEPKPFWLRLSCAREIRAPPTTLVIPTRELWRVRRNLL